MDETSVLKPDSPPSNLRRRNSITVPVVPSQLNLLAAAITNSATGTASPPLAFELLPIKPSSSSPSLSYTSLRDILPSAAATATGSPAAASAANSGYEISIRNRLVKQAAWAYLQPMSSSPGSSTPHFLRRVWRSFSACLSFLNLRIISTLAKGFDRVFRVVRGNTNHLFQ